MDTAVIVREPCQGGTWLNLPARMVPRPVAWGMVAAGLALIAFMLFWMHGASGGWHYRGPGDLIPILFGMLGLPGLVIAVGVLGLGVGLLTGSSRCRVCVRMDSVLVREELGPLHWTRRTDRTGLRGVLVRDGETMQSAVLLRRRDAADMRCAPGYPAAILRLLAEGMGALLGADAAVTTSDQAPPPGNLTVEESGGRLAVSLTASRSWVPLAVFDLLWLGFVGFFTAVALGLAGGKPASWGMAAFTLPFWAVGIGLALLCMHTATHRVSLLWDGSRLTLLDVSVLRRKIQVWMPDELTSVLVSERGSGSGRYRVVALRQRSGGDHDLAVGLDAEAQEWIAARLRRVLGLAQHAA